MRQRTIISPCFFEGKGLHTGQVAKLKILPAQENTGIIFRRVDLGEDVIIKPVSENVTTTARSTTISNGEASVSTIEHLMATFYGMGIDNAIVDIDNIEVPILDGSAVKYVEAFRNNIKEQDADRIYLDIDQVFELSDESTGSRLRLTPSDMPSFDIKVDFNSKVLGVQTAHWDPSVDFSKEIGVCRTFCFFHEIEYLLANNLIKGGDIDNAIVIVEKPVSPESLENIKKLFNRTDLEITDKGYLNNLKLHFPNECGRHKMLDILGDLSLIGYYVNAYVDAFKPGHKINTKMAGLVREKLLKSIK